jgi:hypothetical protein
MQGSAQHLADFLTADFSTTGTIVTLIFAERA